MPSGGSILASARTLADYAERLERVLVHLAGNLDREIDLDRLAEMACFWPFHFHRVHHALPYAELDHAYGA